MALKIDISKFNKNLRRLSKKLPRQVALNALEKTADKIINDTKPLTPVDTGRLRDSLERKSKVTPTKVTVSIFSDVEYALIVHEDLDARHTVGGAKYLERAIKKNRNVLRRNIVKELKKVT